MTAAERAEQRRAALHRAHAVRSARASVKRELRQGLTTLRDALTRKECATIAVDELLQAVRGYGPTRTSKVLAACGVQPKRAVARLSERQRAALVAIVDATPER